MATQQMAELRKQLSEEKADAVRRALNTPDGKVLLDVLNARFYDGDLFGADDRETNRNLGAREVVKYLRFLVQVSEVSQGERRTGRQ